MQRQNGDGRHKVAAVSVEVTDQGLVPGQGTRAVHRQGRELETVAVAAGPISES